MIKDSSLIIARGNGEGGVTDVAGDGNDNDRLEHYYCVAGGSWDVIRCTYCMEMVRYDHPPICAQRRCRKLQTRCPRLQFGTRDTTLLRFSYLRTRECGHMATLNVFTCSQVRESFSRMVLPLVSKFCLGACVGRCIICIYILLV